MGLHLRAGFRLFLRPLFRRRRRQPRGLLALAQFVFQQPPLFFGGGHFGFRPLARFALRIAPGLQLGLDLGAMLRLFLRALRRRRLGNGRLFGAPVQFFFQLAALLFGRGHFFFGQLARDAFRFAARLQFRFDLGATLRFQLRLFFGGDPRQAGFLLAALQFGFQLAAAFFGFPHELFDRQPA